MPSSKILKSQDAVNVVFDFNPRPFAVHLPEQAKDFLQAEGTRKKSEFKINELVAQQIGLTASEKRILEEKVERLAIEKLAEVQEEAYREAYELGQNEGRDAAFASVKADLENQLENFNNLIQTISNLKKELVTFNEAHIIKLVSMLAGKVAMQHIEENKDAIMPVLTAALEDAQNEEKVIVKISPGDLQFIESQGEQLKDKFSNIKNLKFEARDEIHRGGCVIETNYGVVDATVEERVKRLWEHFSEKVPSVKDQVG